MEEVRLQERPSRLMASLLQSEAPLRPPTRRAAQVPHPARSGEIQAETQPYCVLLGVGLPDCW